jgi:N-acetylglucosaminyldiphosphoundecaprenol N-acetyl-beta-D-mannosaminyltransferase
MGERLKFIGIEIDALTMAETVSRARRAMRCGTRLHYTSLNVAKFVKLRRDPDLHRDVTCSDLVGVDGMGVVFAGRLLNLNVSERVAGIDLMQALISVCAQEGYRPYFLGASPEVLARAIEKIRRQYPSLEIAGAQHGYYSKVEEPRIVEAVRNSKAQCLFIALPTPHKERFLAAYRDKLGVPFVMGVGGTLDVIADRVKRAPSWMQKCGFEWLYRLIQEPRRLWKRYLTTNVAFVAIVAREFVRTRICMGS